VVLRDVILGRSAARSSRRISHHDRPSIAR
jgi:hypothetical protein